MMTKTGLVALAFVAILLPQTAQSKTFRENDNSTNNACAYVHNWFLKAKAKHAVYVTTGGVPYGAKITRLGRCQAGAADSLAAAKAYAIGKCDALARKSGIREKCVVVESR